MSRNTIDSDFLTSYGWECHEDMGFRKPDETEWFPLSEALERLFAEEPDAREAYHVISAMSPRAAAFYEEYLDD